MDEYRFLRKDGSVALVLDRGYIIRDADGRAVPMDGGGRGAVLYDGPLGVLMKQVVHHIAHTPIRTRGTFCGSIAHADPASEWCLLAATLGARMRARSVRGERFISEPGFFEGMMATALAPDELLLDTRC